MKRLLTFTLALALLAVPAAQAKVVAKGSGTSAASAGGSVKSPKKLFVDVNDSTTFGQTIDVSWSVSCTAPGFKFAFKQGSFVKITRIYRRLPVPLKHPSKCHVDASASQSDFFEPPFVIYLKLVAKR
jgi:hypothetical protein